MEGPDVIFVNSWRIEIWANGDYTVTTDGNNGMLASTSVPGSAAFAGSGGRRNTCSQFTRGSFKAQRFSGALIQAQRDLVEMRLRVDKQGDHHDGLPPDSPSKQLD